MIKLRQILEAISSDKKFYHGTRKESAGMSILKNGIKPGNIDVKRGHKLTPVMGKVYITDNLKTAVMYVIGADMLGEELPESFLKDSRYGYLFIVDGSQISSPQPDEDSIGEILFNLFSYEYGETGDYKFPPREKLQWLKDLAKSKLTQRQLHSFTRGIYNDYADLAVAGKKLVKFMNDRQKEQLIDMGANVASEGILHPTEAWKFDKKLCPKLKENGSNFFDLAKRIK